MQDKYGGVSIAPVPLTQKPKFLKSQGAYLVAQCGGSPQRLEGLRGIDGNTELKGTIAGLNSANRYSWA